mmetsp:Transcript_43537/g.63891  ORF Transcript_43537/g.63891 Transcript_43537/m.63891 type:complete len:163 (+) Transcript_43537:111-599(+)
MVQADKDTTSAISSGLPPRTPRTEEQKKMTDDMDGVAHYSSEASLEEDSLAEYSTDGDTPGIEANHSGPDYSRSDCGFSDTVHDSLMSIGKSMHGCIGEPSDSVERSMLNFGNVVQEVSISWQDFMNGKAKKENEDLVKIDEGPIVTEPTTPNGKVAFTLNN